MTNMRRRSRRAEMMLASVLLLASCASRHGGRDEGGRGDALAQSATVEPMAVEVLTFRVTPGLEDKFLESDAKTWTRELERHPGFVDKRAWIGPRGGTVVLVIRWRTRGEWPNLSPERMTEIDREFEALMDGSDKFELIASEEYRESPLPEPS